jgi:hypothetical protein
MNLQKLFFLNSILIAIIVLFATVSAQAQESSSQKKVQNKILYEDIDNDGDLDKVEIQHDETQVILSAHINIGNEIYKKSRQIGYINNVSRDVDYQIFKDQFKRTLILFGKKHKGNEINLNQSRIFKLPEF